MVQSRESRQKSTHILSTDFLTKFTEQFNRGKSPFSKCCRSNWTSIGNPPLPKKAQPKSHMLYINEIKMIMYLNIKYRTIKLLGKKIEDLELSNEYLELTPKAQSSKRKK